MPELPEVETIRRLLAPAMEGRRVERLEILDPRWCEPAPPRAVADAVRGRRIEALSRRGKYLTWELEDEVYVAMHLRMTGNLLMVPADDDVDGRPPLVEPGDGQHVGGTEVGRVGQQEQHLWAQDQAASLTIGSIRCTRISPMWESSSPQLAS